MKIEEAFIEMKNRGWGYARNGMLIAIGPILNPDYEIKGEHPLIESLAVGTDAIQTLLEAIENSDRRQGHGRQENRNNCVGGCGS